MKISHGTLTLLILALAATPGAGCDLSGLGGGGGGGGGNDDLDADGSDRPLHFYYGPMKLMPAESILYSIEAITGHSFGRWDFTAPDPATAAFATTGNADGTLYPHCRLLGGCMEHRIPLERTAFLGTGYVLQLEKAVTDACSDRAAFGMFPGGVAPSEVTQAIDVIEHQYRHAFGAAPSQADVELSLAYFASHLPAPEFTDVTAMESAGRGHCRALLATNRFLFY
jgi:hypothetical protein